MGGLLLVIAVLHFSRRPQEAPAEPINWPRKPNGMAAWISDTEVLFVEADQVLKPVIVNVRTGQRRIPESLRARLADYPIRLNWSFFPGNGWCVFYISTGDESRCVQVLAKSDGTFIDSQDVGTVAHQVFWIPNRLEWIEFRNHRVGSSWYRVTERGGKREKLRDEPRHVHPIGITTGEAFVVSSTQLPTSEPIELEYWSLESTPRLLESRSIAELPGTVYVARASPTGERIVWAWHRGPLDSLGQMRAIETGFTVSNADARRFRLLRVMPDSIGCVPWWVPSGTAFSFEYENEWFLSSVESN